MLLKGMSLEKCEVPLQKEFQTYLWNVQIGHFLEDSPNQFWTLVSEV